MPCCRLVVTEDSGHGEGECRVALRDRDCGRTGDMTEAAERMRQVGDGMFRVEMTAEDDERAEGLSEAAFLREAVACPPGDGSRP